MSTLPREPSTQLSEIQNNELCMPGVQWMTLEGPIELEYGDSLPKVDIAYETLGTLSPERDNVILICPAFSAHSHVRSHELNPAPGWWERMVGPGLAIDTQKFYVICPSLLGNNHGTTGPTSIHPETGEPYRASFPEITIKDIADVHMRLLDALGVEKVYAAIGGSLGGMQSLELAARYPKRFEKFISVSSTDHTRPYTAAVRHLGRQSIMLDQDFKGGNYDENFPAKGLKLARELGTLFYRSREEFNERFDWKPLRKPKLGAINFDVQSYLNHQGTKAIGRFDPNCYLLLSLAMDLHDVTRGFANPMDAYRNIESKALIVGVPEDRLIPIDEQLALYRSLCDAKVDCTWAQISSSIGHDAFLVEHELLTPIFRDFLER